MLRMITNRLKNYSMKANFHDLTRLSKEKIVIVAMERIFK